MQHKATATISLNATAAESAELISWYAAPEPVQVKITPICKSSTPRPSLLVMDRAAIV